MKPRAGARTPVARLPIPVAAWLTLAITLLVTVLVWAVVRAQAEKVAYTDFRSRVEEARSRIAQRMFAYEQVLRGAVGLFHASGSVSRSEWRAYVASLRLDASYPGIQGVGYVVRVLPHERAAHIRRVRAEGFPGYTIWPEGERAEYTSIVYLEPANARNRRAFGYDMFSEPVRRAAMERARDTGAVAVSGRVTLQQETAEDVQAGFLMYLPLYRAGMPLTSVAERRAALAGYAYSPFRAADLMRGTLGRELADVDIEVYDGAGNAPEALMYDHDGVRHDVPGARTPRFAMRSELPVQGHTWTLWVATTPAFEARADTGRAAVVLPAGVIISLLFAGIVWSLATHRTRAEHLAAQMTATVREREAFISALVDSAADGIVTIDEHGMIQSFNRAAETIFQYPAGEVLGRNVRMLMPEPQRSQHADYLGRFLAGGAPHVIGIGREVTGRRRNGEEFPLELSVSEIDQEGQRVFTGIVRDITARKQAEEALRRSEERFDLAMQGATDGLWDWDLQTNRVYFSPRWKAMLGYAENEISDHLEEWSSRVHPDDLAQTTADVQAHLAGRTPQYLNEHRVRHKGGHYLWILDRGIVQRDPAGVPYRMVGTHTDITERKQIERMKSEFVSTVSHELRTPLTSIRGALGLIAGGAAGTLDEPARRLVDIAHRNCDRLLHLINDLLDMEKIQSGKIEFAVGVFPLMPLVNQVIEANRPYAQQFNVALELVEGLSGARARVDPERLNQVLTNLLSNAAKFSPPAGRVEVRVAADGAGYRVSVTDYGPGIAPAFRERLFEKFSQADSSDTRRKGGTGLGLSIAKALIERMGGQIGFDSVPGAGATFYVIVPAA